jgi:hypothetical protein
LGLAEIEDEAPLCSAAWRLNFRGGTMNMRMRLALAAAALVFVAALCGAADKTETVKGYVLDSACAFTKSLEKPISAECATKCANGGSPLVILADGGVIYWPIGDTTPAVGQNAKLVAYAGQKVTATGKVYVRGGSHAMVIEKIERLGAK